MASNPTEVREWVQVAGDLADLWAQFAITPRERAEAEAEKRRLESEKTKASLQVAMAQQTGRIIGMVALASLTIWLLAKARQRR